MPKIYRPHFKVHVLIFLIMFCWTFLGSATEKPNLILFITDDQTHEMFNFAAEGKGQNLCPNIDKLWKEGTLLRQHHVSSPVCTPSRFSALTGAYASRSKCEWLTGPLKWEKQAAVQWNSFITPENDTFVRVLRKNGYRTGAVGKNHVIYCDSVDTIKPKFNSNPRDPEVIKKLSTITELLRIEYGKAGFDYAEAIYHNNPDYIGPLELAVHNQEYITEAALNFLKSTKKEQPFFLYMATTLPHGPEEKARSWGADPLNTPMGYVKKAPQGGHPERKTLEERIQKAGCPQHETKEAVLWIDDALGALLRNLENSGQLDNTIIMFLSDHEMGAKGTIYQGGAHTAAFIWKKGGFKAGQEIHSFTNNVDIAPTLLDFAGVSERPQPCDGISFAPKLNGIDGNERQSLYFEIGYTRGIRIGDWKYIALQYSDKAKNMSKEERQKRLDRSNTVFRQQGKKINNEDPMAPFSHMVLVPGGSDADHGAIEKYPAYFEADQLYNLAKDPGEQNNLSHQPELAAVLKEMKEALKVELEKLPGNFPGFVEGRKFN